MHGSDLSLERGAASEGERTLKLKLVKSPIGYNARQRATVQSLGLRKMHQVVVQKDNEVTRGMVNKVRHLVQIVEEGEQS